MPTAINVRECIDDLEYPLLGSFKSDGIHCSVRNGVCLSRSGRPLPNYQVRKLFSHWEGLDGILTVGNPYDDLVYGRTWRI